MPLRLAADIVVYVDGAPNALYRCLSAKRAAGGKQLDHAEIFYDLAAAHEHLNVYRVGEPPQEIEVQVVPRISGGGQPYVIHWGKTAISQVKIGENTEQLQLTSRAEPFHFGGVLSGMAVYDPVGATVELINDDLVFNPEVDGRVLPNRRPLQEYAFGTLNYVFLDPESARTPEAEALSTAPVPWTLAAAAYHLCRLLNPNQVYFQNPGLTDLENTLGTDPNVIVNLKIARGKYLTEALDDLLTPFGFGWYVEYQALGARSINVFQRGVGDELTVALGLPVLADNDAQDLGVEYNVGNTRNWVEVQGDHVHIESTFVLQRAWPTSQDVLNPTTDMGKDTDNYQNNPSYQRAWRDWVLNEAGDYTGVRPEITAPYDLTSLYRTVNFAGTVDLDTRTVPKRRKFLPCITRGTDLAPIGEIHGTVVEWSNDGGETWFPVDRLSDSSCHLLTRECGVRFDGQHVPLELYRAAGKASVRVTATVRYDKRLTAEAITDDTSPQPDIAPVFVDAHARFHFKQVSLDSKFSGQIASGQLTADQVDDTLAIFDYAESLKQAWDMADVSGPIEIFGLDLTTFNYTLSDVVTGVNGRDIDFNAKSPAATARKYPQIVAIEYFCNGDEQKRVLMLETYREEKEAGFV